MPLLAPHFWGCSRNLSCCLLEFLGCSLLSHLIPGKQPGISNLFCQLYLCSSSRIIPAVAWPGFGNSTWNQRGLISELPLTLFHFAFSSERQLGCCGFYLHFTELQLPSSLHVRSSERFVTGPQGMICVCAPIWGFGGQKGLPQIPPGWDNSVCWGLQGATASMGWWMWKITQLQCSEKHSPKAGGAGKKSSFAFLWFSL